MTATDKHKFNQIFKRDESAGPKIGKHYVLKAALDAWLKRRGLQEKIGGNRKAIER